MTALPGTSRRRTRIVIYARYSTQEQDASSIDDQFAFCRRMIERRLAITEFEISEISDMELSGELASRPGIDQVRGIENRSWDLLICEDASRLFRHPAACLNLVNRAYDQGIRVICVNDDVDTSVRGWEGRLHDVAGHHAKTNELTRNRIKRKQDGLWEAGAAMGLLRPGYKRRCSKPATDREPAKGPFFDEVDAQWAPVIHHAYEMMANDDPAWLVAGYLTDRCLPKCNNSTTPEWTDEGAIALIRRTIHRGFERFRVWIANRERSFGPNPQ